MKKDKRAKDTMPEKPAGPGYAGQDFAQGRGGAQSGHNNPPENSNQFENKGEAGFAAEPAPNSSEEINKGR